MPTTPKATTKTIKEFLVVSIPPAAQEGSTLRLLAIKGTQAAAEKAVAKLDPGTLGRVAVVERKALFERQAVVENRVLTESIGGK